MNVIVLFMRLKICLLISHLKLSFPVNPVDVSVSIPRNKTCCYVSRNTVIFPVHSETKTLRHAPPLALQIIYVRNSSSHLNIT